MGGEVILEVCSCSDWGPQSVLGSQATTYIGLMVSLSLLWFVFLHEQYQKDFCELCTFLETHPKN